MLYPKWHLLSLTINQSIKYFFFVEWIKRRCETDFLHCSFPYSVTMGYKASKMAKRSSNNELNVPRAKLIHRIGIISEKLEYSALILSALFIYCIAVDLCTVSYVNLISITIASWTVIQVCGERCVPPTFICLCQVLPRGGYRGVYQCSMSLVLSCLLWAHWSKYLTTFAKLYGNKVLNPELYGPVLF